MQLTKKQLKEALLDSAWFFKRERDLFFRYDDYQDMTEYLDELLAAINSKLEE